MKKLKPKNKPLFLVLNTFPINNMIEGRSLKFEAFAKGNIFVIIN